MKGFASIICCGLLLVCMTVLVGCSDSGDGDGGGSAAVDESQTVADVQAEAAKMDEAGLKAQALKYKDAILAKRVDIDKVMAQLKDLSPTELMGEKSKDLRASIESINKTITGLTENYKVFISALQEKGVDVSSLGL